MFRFVVLILVGVMLLGLPGIVQAKPNSATIEGLSLFPETLEGKEVVVGGWIELAGVAYYNSGENDVVAATYKLHVEYEQTGLYIFVVVTDRNSSGVGNNRPEAVILPEGQYSVFQGKWAMQDHVASFEVTPGNQAWALMADGFDG